MLGIARNHSIPRHHISFGFFVKQRTGICHPRILRIFCYQRITERNTFIWGDMRVVSFHLTKHLFKVCIRGYHAWNAWLKLHLLHPSAIIMLQLLLLTWPQRMFWTPTKSRSSSGCKITIWSPITVLTPRGFPRECPQNEPWTQLYRQVDGFSIPCPYHHYSFIRPPFFQCFPIHPLMYTKTLMGNGTDYFVL